jgi:hypothetical protein
MAYLGERMIACPDINFDWANTYAVVVSGDGPKFCGHLLLNVGGPGGYYFQVTGDSLREMRSYPRWLNAAGYRLYLASHQKKELKRFRVAITKPDAAMLKMEELLSVHWTWGILPHNCASFVEEIVSEGGSAAGLYTNCPALENFQ